MPVFLPLTPDPPEDLVQGWTSLMEVTMGAGIDARAARGSLWFGAKATTAGAMVDVGQSAPWIPRGDVVQSTTLFIISGTTRDSAGAPLGNCRVVVLETGRLAVTGCPVVAEVISDGSGLFSVVVPMDVGYQLIAYLPGSPDVAGITRNDVTATEG